MTTKVKGTEGIEFPDATVQASAAMKAGDPGTIAASCVVTVSAGVPTKNSSYNVGVIGRPGAGQFNVTLDPPQPDSKFAVSVIPGNFTAGIIATTAAGTSPTNVSLAFYSLAGVLTDPSSFSFSITRQP